MIALNGTPINITIFPDQTSQVWKVSQLEIPDTNYVYVKWTFEYEGEFMLLAQLKSLIDRLNFRAALEIQYLPYARQDKEVSNFSTFALHPFAQLLNFLDFEEVIIQDPHSNLSLELINNAKAIYPNKQISKVIKKVNPDIICYPDAGAVDKYSNVYDYSYIYGKKTRNQLTGQITDYKLVGEVKDKILIVDDICDGGATFICLAQKLKEMGASEVNLFVTHGIFSKGLKILKDNGINKVFTADGEVGEHQQHITYRRL
jgi:ribose-phosphate pyrophosphokinase